MAFAGLKINPELGEFPCETDRDSWYCKNMVPVKCDTGMDLDHYRCTVCNRERVLDPEIGP